MECLQSSFYCVLYRNPDLPDPIKGWTVKTSPVPIKDPYFATLKSNNYLPNALVALDAQLEGYDQVSLFVSPPPCTIRGSYIRTCVL